MLRGTAVRAVLVEANPIIFVDLQQNLRNALGASALSTGRVVPRNVAASRVIKSRPISFYVVDEKTQFTNAPHWATKQISSVLRANVETGVRLALENPKIGGFHHEHALREAPRYVRPISVPCEPPGAMLRASGMEPSGVKSSRLTSRASTSRCSPLSCRCLDSVRH